MSERPGIYGGVNHNWIPYVLCCMQNRALDNHPKWEEMDAVILLKQQMILDGRIRELRRIEQAFAARLAESVRLPRIDHYIINSK